MVVTIRTVPNPKSRVVAALASTSPLQPGAPGGLVALARMVGHMLPICSMLFRRWNTAGSTCTQPSRRRAWGEDYMNASCVRGVGLRRLVPGGLGSLGMGGKSRVTCSLLTALQPICPGDPATISSSEHNTC